MEKKSILILIVIAVIFTIGLLFSVYYTKIEIKHLTTPFLEIPIKEEVVFIADEEGVTPEGKESLVDANNKFALNFYNEIYEDEEGENIFFSPYSIFTALSITYEGSRGETAEEIKNVFGFPKEDDVRRPGMAAIYNRLNPESAKYEMKTANSLWIQDDYQVLDEFKNTVINFYGGEVSNVDFVSDSNKAREEINDWVAKKTNDIIEDLFPEGSLSELTRLVIANAIYFKGSWDVEFDEENTRKEDFYVSEEETVEVPMMRNLGEEYGYFENDLLQVLEMKYEGDETSMLVFLPREVGLSSLEDSISLEQIKEWKEEINNREVNVYFPKFEMNTDYKLNNYLSNLGMPAAFTPPSAEDGADFSGMSGKRDLYIHSVVHDAFIAVDEEGTEAAAATGVEIGIESYTPISEFRADRPFLFLIQETESGNILFLGRVVNPLGE